MRGFVCTTITDLTHPGHGFDAYQVLASEHDAHLKEANCSVVLVHMFVQEVCEVLLLGIFSSSPKFIDVELYCIIIGISQTVMAG